jgi:acyl-CoA reductase-like NAD-dependent aldehyde dehydrogenase
MELEATDDAGLNKFRADQMLELARWAAGAFQSCTREQATCIAEAAARAGEAKAEDLAHKAEQETGFGIAAHKMIKNRLCSIGIFECYKDEDFVSHRIDPLTKMIEVPKPAGVVFALIPSTNPVATVFFTSVRIPAPSNAVARRRW